MYSLPNIFWLIKSRKIRWAGHVVHMGQYRGICRVLMGKSDGKSPRHRWENNIKMGLQEVGCGGMDCIKMAQDRDRCLALINAVMNVWVPKNAENF